MELTIENLIAFIEAKNPNIGTIVSNTQIRDCAIDGDDAIELLIELQVEFNINFQSFNFQEYFLEEIEISKGLSWFGLKKTRKIDEELTIVKLFKIMQKLPANIDTA